MLGDYVKGQLVDGFSRSPDSAMVLAWLSETAPGTRATQRNGPPKRQHAIGMHDLKRQTGDLVPLKYFSPDAGRG